MARILVVDGDERYRLTCSQDLEREGHEVLTASTGIDALRLTAEHAPDIVVTEVQLPGMDGLDLMVRLLAKHSRIIVILNSRSPHYTDSFLSWSADACCTKSADSREVPTKVRELLNKKTATAEKTVGPLGNHPSWVWHKELGPHVREIVQH